jgi:hypothetical protein
MLGQARQLKPLMATTQADVKEKYSWNPIKGLSMTRIKHLNVKYHHFREEAKKGTVNTCHISTEEQMTDVLQTIR